MRIVYATDGSGEATGAGRFLEALRLPAGSAVQVVSVLHEAVPLVNSYVDAMVPNWEMLAEVRRREEELAERAVAEASQRLEREGVEITPSLRHGEAAREILRAAEEFQAELVVVGSRGLTGLDSLLLGSVARNVAKHAQRPVLVARAPRHGLRRAVMATDGSEHARHAVRMAAGFPWPEGMELTAASVARPYTPFPGLFPTDREEFNATILEVNRERRAAVEELVRDAAGELAAAGLPVRTAVREGDPAAEILAAVEEEQADLVVAGARGASLIEGLLVGSVADRLLKEAACSVLLVH